jgi:hypothetical protein
MCTKATISRYSVPSQTIPSQSFVEVKVAQSNWNTSGLSYQSRKMMSGSVVQIHLPTARQIAHGKNRTSGELAHQNQNS